MARAGASRQETLDALFALFRQQERAIADAHAKQTEVLRFIMAEELPVEKDQREAEFHRSVSADTAATSGDLAGQETHSDENAMSEHTGHGEADVEQVIDGTVCTAERPRANPYVNEFHSSEAINGQGDRTAVVQVHGDSEIVEHERVETDGQVSGALTMQLPRGECKAAMLCESDAACEKGVACENSACEKGVGCDQLTSEGQRPGCLRPLAPPEGGEGGCGLAAAPSLTSDSGGRSSPCLSAGSRSDSETRGRKRRSPDDGLVFDDDSFEDDESNVSSDSQSHQATWAATLTKVEHELASGGLSAATTLAVSSIGCLFQESPPQLTCHGWVSMASIVRHDNHEELYQTAGVHYESKRIARRSAYCQVLQYAATQIAASMVKAFRPSSTSSGLRLEDLHHHLHTRIKDLLARAAHGRTVNVVTGDSGEPQ